MRAVARALLAVAVAVAAPVQARDALGVFSDWGAFRDPRPFRCFAIAEPFRGSAGKWRPFASVAHWPGAKVRGQLHLRLSRAKRGDAAVTLAIDDQRFSLSGAGGDVWSPDARTDAAIVAAIRSGRSMSVSTVAANGGAFADVYRLKGAATAIDAAALGCARAR
jgi:hypothetical protein